MITGIQVSSFKPMLTTEEEVRTAFFKMKEMGCDTVQLQWIDWSVTPEFIAQALKDAGISSVSTQDFYQTVKEHKDYFIRLNQLCGSEWVCVSGIPDSNRTPEGLQAFVKELSEFQKELREQGLKLCFHPRHMEFRPIGQADPVEYLMDHLPEEAALCLDLYHVNHAGLSMEKVIRKYRGKICMVHFKDYRKAGDQEILVPAGGYRLEGGAQSLQGDRNPLWICGAGALGERSVPLPEGSFRLAE